MKETYFIKTMIDGIDKTTELPYFHGEVDKGIEVTYVGNCEDGVPYNFTVYFSKTNDKKYKWDVTEKTTGFSVTCGRTKQECDMFIVNHEFDIAKRVMGKTLTNRSNKIFAEARKIVKDLQYLICDMIK